jgi:hypothetical protein
VVHVIYAPHTRCFPINKQSTASISTAMASVDRLVPNVPITTLDRIRFTIDQLPTLTAKDVQLDDSCAICLTGFASILSNEVEVEASTELDADTEVQLGITRLVGCGHLFCRKESVDLLLARTKADLFIA